MRELTFEEMAQVAGGECDSKCESMLATAGCAAGSLIGSGLLSAAGCVAGAGVVIYRDEIMQLAMSNSQLQAEAMMLNAQMQNAMTLNLFNLAKTTILSMMSWFGNAYLGGLS